MKNNIISQYIPEFYESHFSKTNVVTTFGVILDEIVKQIDSIGMNDWESIDDMMREFKIDEVTIPGFTIARTELLKSFFTFKGTNSDLAYITKILGYDTEIYIDGSISHKGVNGQEELVQTTAYKGPGRTPPCEISLRIVLDLNDPNYAGYNSNIINQISDIMRQRISVCAYISSIAVTIKARDIYETLNFTNDRVMFKTITTIKEEVISEAFRPPLKYGQKYGTKYGRKYKNKYGQHKLPIFNYLEEDLVIKTRRVGTTNWTEI